MSSISGPGATPPLEPIAPRNETSSTNQAQQMDYMLQMIYSIIANVKNPNQNDILAAEKLMIQFQNQMSKQPIPLDSMANELNQLTNQFDMKYGLTFPQIWPKDPEGHPGMNLLSWMEAALTLLEKDSNDPTVGQEMQKLFQFMNQKSWTPDQVFDEVQGIVQFMSQQGLSFAPMSHNFFGRN